MPPFRQSQSDGHDTKTKRSDQGGQQEPVLKQAAPKRVRPNDHGQDEPDFVDQPASQKPAGGREQSDQDSGRARNGRRTGPIGPSQSGRAGRSRDRRRFPHRRQDIEQTRLSYNISSEPHFETLPSGVPHANSRSPHGLSTPLRSEPRPNRSRPARTVEPAARWSPRMVFAMVVVGGITRLTESGLSITQVEANQRRHPAANAGRLAARFRSLQANAAISVRSPARPE